LRGSFTSFRMTPQKWGRVSEEEEDFDTSNMGEVSKEGEDF
jgi:hypothetical protein